MCAWTVFILVLTSSQKQLSGKKADMPLSLLPISACYFARTALGDLGMTPSDQRIEHFVAVMAHMLSCSVPEYKAEILNNHDVYHALARLQTVGPHHAWLEGVVKPLFSISPPSEVRLLHLASFSFTHAFSCT